MSITDQQNAILDTSLDSFQQKMDAAGLIAWTCAEPILASAETLDDKLIQSTFNDDIKMNFPTCLLNGYSSSDYQTGLDDLKQAIADIRVITEEYFTNEGIFLTTNANGYNYGRMVTGLVTTMQNDVDTYLGYNAFQKDVATPAEVAMDDHFSEGSNRYTMISDMQHRTQDRFYNFSVTKSTTIMQQFIRRLNDIFARYSTETLVWVRYEGPDDEITRDFCHDRLDPAKGGPYYHEEEVKEWPQQYGEWDGMIPGTDRGSIFVNCGGYSCRHNLIYVKPTDVPPSTIQRVKNKGL